MRFFKKAEQELDGRTIIPSVSGSKFKLCVIVGHERKAPGAVMHKSVGSMTEYAYNSKVAELMSKLAPKFNIDVQVVYRDGIGISGANKKAAKMKPDAVIELHFNAFNQKAFGTETLCTADRNDVEFAKLVQAQMCRVFERPGLSRGVKIIPRNQRGGGNVHGLPGFANCLVEPFFGDNEDEAKMAIEKLENYAHCLLLASAEYFQVP